MTRPLRATRASVFALVCLGVSAAGHAWMSGRAVPTDVVLPGFGLVFALGYAAARRPRGFAAIAGLMLTGELLLHLLFTAAQQAGIEARDGTPGMTSMPGMPGMAMPDPAAPPAAGGASMSAMGGHGALGMLAVHLAAGLASAWWIHRGERAVFALLRHAADAAVALLSPPNGPYASRPGAPANVGSPRPCPLPVYPKPLVHVLVRRGPPHAAF